MNLDRVRKNALKVLREWYDDHRPSADEPAKTYVVCAGLAVTERMHENYPIRLEDIITEKGQVRTGGPFIQNILARHEIYRTYTREGGRTTRAAPVAARSLMDILNEIPGYEELDAEEKEDVTDSLQSWLVERVKEHFSRQKLRIEIDPRQPGPLVVAQILEVGSERGVSGAVAEHLVGAKLSLRHPDQDVEVRPHTGADKQTGRPGDFFVGDTAFHVTMSPQPPVVERCVENLRNGYRTLLLVPEGKLEAARQMAEEHLGQIGILAIEIFVGQNVEEMAGFGQDRFAQGLRRLLEKYNERISEAESDQSLQVEIPENL